MTEFVTDRWTLTAEFDTVQETIDAQLYEGGLGEAAEFYTFCRKQAESVWGYLNEEIEESVRMEGEIVTVSLNMLEPFEELYRHLLWHTAPKRVDLAREAGARLREAEDAILAALGGRCADARGPACPAGQHCRLPVAVVCGGSAVRYLAGARYSGRAEKVST